MLNHAVHSYASHLCWSDKRLVKVVRLTLAEELEKEELLGGRAESSEHGSMKFCASCLSTITEYSKSCLWVLTSTKSLPQRIDMAM